MSHDEMREMIPAYALDALDHSELLQVEAHLAFCEDCRHDVGEFRDVAAHLAQTGDLRAPPASLRQRVLDRVAALSGPPGLTLRRARRWNLATLAPTWALPAAIVLLVVALAGWAGVLQAQVSHVRQQNQGLASALRDQRTLTYLMASPNVQVVTMESADRQRGPGPRGMLLMTADRQRVLFVGYGLKPLAPDQVYKLWLVRPEERLEAGNITVDKDGYSWVWLDVKRPLVEYTVAGVTVESALAAPDGAPTGSLLLRGAPQPGTIQ